MRRKCVVYLDFLLGEEGKGAPCMIMHSRFKQKQPGLRDQGGVAPERGGTDLAEARLPLATFEKVNLAPKAAVVDLLTQITVVRSFQSLPMGQVHLRHVNLSQ